MTEVLNGQGFVQRIRHNNDDLTVVNAARVSMGKRVDRLVLSGSPEDEQQARRDAGMGLDDALIKYLWEHEHWTPFAHARFGFRFPHRADPIDLLEQFNDTKRSGWSVASVSPGGLTLWGSLYDYLRAEAPPFGIPDGSWGLALGTIRNCAPVSYRASRNQFSTPDAGAVEIQNRLTPGPDRPLTFHLKLPIFVARQLMRSNIGIVYNEVSRRYVDEPPTFFRPDVWRARPTGSIKQGSGDGEVRTASIPDPVDTQAPPCEFEIHGIVNALICRESAIYGGLIEAGVAPEMARMILPQSMMTEVWLTTDERNLRRVVGLRASRYNRHAQSEIREYADAMLEVFDHETGDDDAE